MNTHINAVIVTNAPAPYRVPGWNVLSQAKNINLQVIYCAQPHIDPSLDASAHKFPIHFLTARYKAMERRFLHFDLGIWSLLNRLRPDVVITTGFIPTYLIGFAWAIMHRVPHVAMTDGTMQSENSLSWLHRVVRRNVFRWSSTFVGASEGSRSLYRQYGVPENRIHLSRLSIENSSFCAGITNAEVDFIFCGRFLQYKRPLFAMQVAREAAIQLGRRTSIDFVGSGPMENEMREYAEKISDLVNVRFHGYVGQADLPSRYAAGRIFLFPSEGDVWGVVANEACAAGLAVIVSPHAGAAGELVKDGNNGFVRNLNVGAWAEAAVSLLKDAKLYERFSQSSRARVAEYTFDRAALGLEKAIRQACPVPVVCIIQAVAKQYRLAFFDLLHERLKNQGVKLTVIYSDPNKSEALRNDAVELPITYGHKVRSYWGLGNRVLYQACFRKAVKADLVIVEQASKHVLNYVFLLMRVLRLGKIAYWGHGYDWQQDSKNLSTFIKRHLATKVDWWFAYTNSVARYLVKRGFPLDRITIVQNSIDVAIFSDTVRDFGKEQRAVLRQRMSIPPSAPIGLFCGSMHSMKNLDFLIESALKIRAGIHEFQLILIGSGPDEFIARQAAATHNWIHYIGPQFGNDRAPYFAISDIFLCPGLVGLAVLDAFAAGLPLFTTNIRTHSPEIEYLLDSITGVITEVDSTKYAAAVTAHLCNPVLLGRMRMSALEASSVYGLQPMVENFAKGALGCLARH